DQYRLVKRADEVLAVRRIDGGLAADRAVDLRQQSGRYLHIGKAAQQARGGKPRDIANDTAAQRRQQGLPLDPPGEYLLAELGEMREVFRPLARRQDHRVVLDSGLADAFLERWKMQPRHGMVSHHHDRPAL